ncbi:FtsK/SpoIIIE domain-containing protein [Mycobacterium sp. M23085]|uniref:FtsK/SpoIIIE domain-containing protein n=1 Tax=Mycobacterium sp. M23085 TaxID=3378087 RepID=UPI003877B64A
MTTSLIATLAYETARHVLRDSYSTQGGGEADQPALRVKNLLDPEVEELLQLWASRAEADGMGAVRVVLARDTDVACDERFLADSDKAITWYRNNNDGGLLYVQTKVESDEQGLESMFTVQDRNYLDGSLDSDGFSPERRIIEIAWEQAGSGPAAMPSRLANLLADLRRSLLNHINISVRMFADFALAVAGSLRAEGREVFDDSALTATVGRSLPSLGLLPDEAWDSDSRSSRRLLTNYRLADLMDPNGVDQDPEELLARIRATQFTDESGGALDRATVESWQNACAAFVENRSEEARRQLPLWVYQQIFSKAVVTGVPLGDRVREELTRDHASRLYEFDELDLQESLNLREQEAARRLVEAPPPDEAAPLVDLLTVQTQKLLRKLAYPRDRFFANPFTQIVEVLRSFTPDELEGAELEIRCGRMPDKSASHPSIGLFRFLYAQSLNELIQASSLDPSGVQLFVDPILLEFHEAPRVGSGAGQENDADADEAVEVPVEWDGVPIEIVLRSGDDHGGGVLEEVTNLRWHPTNITWLAFGWIMVGADDAPAALPLLDLPSGDFELLAQEAAARLAPIADLLGTQPSDISVSADDDTISEIVKLRQAFLRSVSDDGLSATSIDQYVEAWTAKLAEARVRFVPNGVLDPRLQAVLSFDVVHSIGQSRALMLLSHPLRLRWLGAYLRETTIICQRALDRALKLNSINENFYLDAVESLSPHGQPPLLANCARTLLVPVAEHGYTESYAAIKQEGQVTGLWKAELDSSALAEVAHQIVNYLRAHPHKSDGISLVFVLPAGGTVPQALVGLLRRNEWKNLPVSCHVFAPRDSWDALVAAFQRLETQSRIAGGERHSPPLQLELAEWTGEVQAAQQLSELEFDIAVIPNFFGDKVDVNEYADAPQERAGSFHTLHDDPTYVDQEAAAGSVSIVLRTESADSVLDDWSTANVRLLRSEAISPQSPDAIDYVKLRIRFEEAGPFFAALHDCSHWVITLDRYVGRDQIESLPQRPDVLTVREGVGQSGLSTLVVSSNAGKAFVVRRLGRKLERISRAIPRLDWHALAMHIYDEIRTVAPGLILRSMGVSRITEEVLGLMVAKRIAERHRPIASDSTVWISLDEHSDWFGGDNAVRADLCRVEVYREEGRLQVGILAVEGKLRQAYDAHGEEQAAITARLVGEALEPNGDGSAVAADALFWRRAVLSALRGAAGRTPGSDSSVIDEVTREDIRTGEFDIAYCEALYSICIYERQAPLSRQLADGVFVYRSSSLEILDLIEGADTLTSLDQTDVLADIRDEHHQGHDWEPGTAIDLTPAEADKSIEPDEQTSPTPSTSADVGASERHGGMTRLQLVEMYQLILDTLSEFGVSVGSPEDGEPLFIEGPAFVQFRVKPDRGVAPKRISDCDSSLRLALALEEGKQLRISIGGGTVNIDVPKADNDRYFVSAEELWQRWPGVPAEGLAVPIGVNQRDEIIEINFSSANSPHMLIGGATGSGKSEALNTILYGLTRFYSPDELKLVLIDPKQTELLAFEQSPHLLGQIGFFDDDAVASLEQAVGEMQRRYELFRSRKVRSLPEYNRAVMANEQLPWQLVVLDEYADLVSEPEARRAIEAAVKRLSQKARACGIHLIIATQKPSAENISTTVRSNLPAQLALRCRGATESRIVMDEPGAETLNGKGDAFLKVADRLERVQCAMVTNAEPDG